MPTAPRLVHDVYFTLNDNSPEACQRLVGSCYDKLAGIRGVQSLLAGTRDPDLSRDVNDRIYDVSLHVVFVDREAHDAYQNAASHLDFIDENRSNWRAVRVFDSTVGER
ncbi:MAG: Dabb family protein [Planctomycetes bacterium]|nr:Dabb family protein [Planctomycetota bacterium]